MILAIDEKNGIWRGNDLAWRLKTDMEYFKQITVQTQDPEKINALVMGRKTWESIPEKFRPLPGRINCVLTRDEKFQNENIVVYHDIDSCLEDLGQYQWVENIFIIWWANIYNQLLSNESLDKIYITRVEWDFECDTFFDGIPNNFHIVSKSQRQEEKGIWFTFEIYKKQ